MRTLGHVVIVALLFTACASATEDKKQPPTPAREVASGGARIRGGGIRMDVQVGRTFVQRPTRTTEVTAKPNAVVTP